MEAASHTEAQSPTSYKTVIFTGNATRTSIVMRIESLLRQSEVMMLSARTFNL